MEPCWLGGAGSCPHVPLPPRLEERSRVSRRVLLTSSSPQVTLQPHCSQRRGPLRWGRPGGAGVPHALPRRYVCVAEGCMPAGVGGVTPGQLSAVGVIAHPGRTQESRWPCFSAFPGAGHAAPSTFPSTCPRGPVASHPFPCMVQLRPLAPALTLSLPHDPPRAARALERLDPMVALLQDLLLRRGPSRGAEAFPPLQRHWGAQRRGQLPGAIRAGGAM